MRAPFGLFLLRFNPGDFPGDLGGGRGRRSRLHGLAQRVAGGGAGGSLCGIQGGMPRIFKLGEQVVDRALQRINGSRSGARTLQALRPSG